MSSFDEKGKARGGTLISNFPLGTGLAHVRRRLAACANNLELAMREFARASKVHWTRPRKYNMRVSQLW